MIRGTVEPTLDPVVELELQGPNGVEHVDAVVDTGFSGWLSLPEFVIRRLGLEYLRSGPATLADGTVVEVQIYEAEVEWHDAWKVIRIDLADTDPLVGMKLLRGSALHVDVTEGGAVTIAPLDG